MDRIRKDESIKNTYFTIKVKLRVKCVHKGFPMLRHRHTYVYEEYFIFCFSFSSFCFK
ncbi:hypothetical protein Smp_197850 [Schistosoma mansoni]|uniref:hypothetical protein n=1 Tax=Schistosoma mansoni TaxID=6183 RepID=UPI00022DC377|nr:hypothetical protein Smp_197850 [Schistosoma mansoni]|eukprot:XP_018652074.1 hypothetical protein Smp_197850 [Schistosoma mansoni]